MNKEKKLEQVRKSCNVGKIIISVLKVITIVSAILCLIGGILVFAQRDKVNEMMSNATNSGVEIDKKDMVLNGFVQLDLDFTSTVEDGRYDVMILVEIAIGLVACVFAAIIFGIVENMLKVVIESESPFSEAVIKRFKVLFITITVLVAICTGAGTAAATGLVLWCIYTIFDYGYAIQTEVDETL